MAKFGNLVRGGMNQQVASYLNTLELRTGAMPADADQPQTGTRLCIWFGTVPWERRSDISTMASIELANAVSAIPVASGTIGYACLRYMPQSMVTGETYTMAEALAIYPNSFESALLTVGLEGSGADIEFFSLDVTEGVPIMLSKNSGSVMKGA